MRHGKVFLFALIYCLLPLTAYAENKKIIISCAELTVIEIKQPPPGFLFSRQECGDKCFYLEMIMADTTAQRVIAKINTYKHVTRELYLGDYLLFIADPFHIDTPYSQKISNTAAYLTLEEAINDVRKMCPNATIKEPDTVRR